MRGSINKREMPDQPRQILYICYFGVGEPLVRTQVIPYLLEIIKDGVNVYLLTFEPQHLPPEAIEAERVALAEKGIVWHQLRYHKSPSVPATFYDIFNGARFVRKLNRRHKFEVLHCRVHVPALMGTLARKFSRHKPKILFDIRGFFPEEYTDAGIWPENGWLYRVVKRVEKWLLREADGFVVLTEKARNLLFSEAIDGGFDKLGRPVEVIPCCVDLARFAVNDDLRSNIRRELSVQDRYVIAYVGSFGGWYLSDEMFELFAAVREADPLIFVMVLTQRDTEQVAKKLNEIGFGKDDFFVSSISPAEIPGFLAAADAAVSFVKACYSKQASSPTKNAEYLASGLPIMANSGVGDVDKLITEEGVGVLIDKFDRESYISAFEHLKALGDIGEKCRRVASEQFNLETVGGVRYRRLYQRLFCKDGD